MRSSRAAIERNGSFGTGGVSLFPFLAVLICTMGALILLLVLIARNARSQAVHAALVSSDASELNEKLEAELELVRWRIEQLHASRAAAEEEVADARLKLGQIEDHGRQLSARLAQLESAWADLQTLAAGGAVRVEALTKELAAIEAQIAAAEQELAAARAEAAGRRGSYAVVPYEGPHGTRRQPIYIECRGDAIVLQPEKIVLTEADFDGPLGPGNPLDVALRARREYLLERGRIDPSASGEPYPLLLVRPDGIAAYYAARAAMKSWESEFGYELIGEDWKLAFPPADPQLAAQIARAVDAARVRQSRLASAVPRLSTAEPRPKYRAAPYRGGAVLDGPTVSEPPPIGGMPPRAGERDALESTPPAGAETGPSAGAAVRPLADKRRGLAAAKEISLGPTTEESIEQFVSSVWEVMETWGIAGRGMHWRPVLNVRVDAEAEGRFADLKTLLDKSGLDVRRKDGP